MTDKSTKATDYDLTDTAQMIDLLTVRTEYFNMVLNTVLGTEELEDNVAVLLGVVLGSQIAGEYANQLLRAEIAELRLITEQQSSEILALGTVK